MQSDCIFCKMVNGQIPTNKVYEDDDILAFYDINPAAPVHFLVIPKKHIESALFIEKQDEKLVGHIICTITNIAKELNLQEGFRIVNNCGNDGGQTVMHLHYHVLGKRSLTWPPG